MTDFAKCTQAGCSPVMQARHEDPDAHLNQVHDNNRDDIRIVCSTCGLATPWNVVDAAGMKGIGKDHSAKVWTEMVAKKDTRAAMFELMKKEFGEEAVAEHLKHSL